MHGIFGSLLKEKSPFAAMGTGGSSAGTDDDDTAASVRVSETPAQNLRKGQIAVDVFEESGYLIIKAPIAGVKLADLDIDIADNVITIRGHRQQLDTVEAQSFILQECYWGHFEREVTLPFTINAARVRATFSKDNILKIFVPKEGGRKVKIVKINEGG
jgi:HSP20 family protein